MPNRLRLLPALAIALIGAYLVSRPATQKRRPAASPTAYKALASKLPPKCASGDYLRIALTKDGTGFAPVMDVPGKSPNSRIMNPARPVCPLFPRNFAAPIRVKSGVADVTSAPLNANVDSAGTINGDGNLVYTNAFHGCDVSYRCSAYKTEEFITVKNANAQMCWSWMLDTHGLKPRLTPASTIELCDEQNVPRLRINAPEGKDANGKPLRVGGRLKLALEGKRVTLTATLDECAFPVVIDPTWSSTGSLAFPRWRHTATLLANGNVLVVGGLFPITSGSLAECEIYSPATGTWRATASLPISRHSHAAARLSDGRVLIVGGSNYTPPFTLVDISCLVFDPLLETWNSLPSISVSHQYGHTLTELNDGRVLLVGGNGSTAASLTDVEILDANATGPWVTTNALLAAHAGQFAVVLQNGKVLIAGGQNSSGLATLDCELFDPGSNQWSSTQSMLFPNYYVAAGFSYGAMLQNGLVLTAGGESASQLSEIYDPKTDIWSATGNLNTSRTGSAIASLSNGGALVIGGYDTTAASELSSCEYFNPTTMSYSATASLNNPKADAVVNNFSNGTLLITGNLNAPTTIAEIFDPSTVPTINADESLTTVLEGQFLPFASITSNPDSYSLTYLWNFGDGTASSDPNPVHAYATAGVYNASVQISGTSLIGTPFSVASNTITITVYHNSDRPTARFVSSDLNGFVGQPVGFDATFSTDPLNNIVSYVWDFGDGSPQGTGQLISRQYAAEGTYTVTLTIADGRGLTDTTTLTMVILPASQAGLLNPNIKYSVNWNRSASNADSLSLSATVNVGTTSVSQSSPLSLNVVGQSFTGTSTTPLLLSRGSKSGAQVKWQIKKITKKGAPPGTYAVKCAIRHASLGQAFALAGVTGTKNSTAKIPVRLGVGGSAFESSINSQFRFGSGGAKASGGGQGPK